MKAVFVDTLYWVALVKPADQWKDAAKGARQKIGKCRLVTTDEVLTEFLNALSEYGPEFRHRAGQTVRRMMKNPNVDVLPQTRETFLLALDRYEQRGDKSYSLVDCTSMNAMDQEGIREALTHDHHFEQEGFTVLMKNESSS
jgi:predicted nucleic acid-binding protein